MKKICMGNRINIGDVFYRVNRDDRKSTFEGHHFIYLEVTSIIKDGSIWAFGINNCPIDLYGFIKRKRKGYNGNINDFYVANRERSQVAVMGTTMVEMKKSLEEGLQCKIYSDKDSSKDEVKKLLDIELKEINRKIEGLLEDKGNIENNFKSE